MNKIFTLSCLLFLSFSISAQESVTVAVGSSYSNQTYYSLSDNTTISLDNESWDIAFMLGDAEAGILLNESASASFSGPEPELKLYITYVEDFSNTIDETLLTDTLYNNEANWQEGAFNSIAEQSDPDDYGWGAYNSSTGVVEGIWVYAIKLRDESWKKIKIESLENGIYTMKYADLDGANEVITTINKGDYDSPMAFFSFETEAVTASPTGWDLLFERYLAALFNTGEVIYYPTVGILTAPGIEVAQVDNVVPADTQYADHIDSLSTANDVIGFDWKFFDLAGFQWVVETERAYFLKMPDNQVLKFNFINFAGSSTGNITFEKTDLGVITALNDPLSNFKEASVFPNPIVDDFAITFSLKEARTDMQIRLINTLGQTVWHAQTDGHQGFNALNIQSPNIAAGYYQLVIGNGDDLWSSAIILK